jgi:hypothetical protein
MMLNNRNKFRQETVSKQNLQKENLKYIDDFLNSSSEDEDEERDFINEKENGNNKNANSICTNYTNNHPQLKTRS